MSDECREAEAVNERVTDMRRAVLLLADVVDDLARERHEAREHDGDYARCDDDLCGRAREARRLS